MSEHDWEALVGAQGELAAVPATLRGSADHMAAAAGQSVFRMATRPAKMFWVLDGEIRLIRRSRSGTEIVLQRTSSGFVARGKPRFVALSL